MKTMRVFMDNGVEKVISVPGVKATVIAVNVADGSKSAFVNPAKDFNYQDIEPLYSNGAVIGYGATGLETGTTVPNGTGGCINANGCSQIRGHISYLDTSLNVVWTKTFNDFTGGTGIYAGVTPLSEAVMITECWGLTVRFYPE